MDKRRMRNIGVEGKTLGTVCPAVATHGRLILAVKQGLHFHASIKPVMRD
jgi:hypothetical protein